MHLCRGRAVYNVIDVNLDAAFRALLGVGFVILVAGGGVAAVLVDGHLPILNEVLAVLIEPVNIAVMDADVADPGAETEDHRVGGRLRGGDIQLYAPVFALRVGKGIGGNGFGDQLAEDVQVLDLPRSVAGNREGLRPFRGVGLILVVCGSPRPGVRRVDGTVELHGEIGRCVEGADHAGSVRFGLRDGIFVLDINARHGLAARVTHGVRSGCGDIHRVVTLGVCGKDLHIQDIPLVRRISGVVAVAERLIRRELDGEDAGGLRAVGEPFLERPHGVLRHLRRITAGGADGRRCACVVDVQAVGILAVGGLEGHGKVDVQSVFQRFAVVPDRKLHGIGAVAVIFDFNVILIAEVVLIVCIYKAVVEPRRALIDLCEQLPQAACGALGDDLIAGTAGQQRGSPGAVGLRCQVDAPAAAVEIVFIVRRLVVDAARVHIFILPCPGVDAGAGGVRAVLRREHQLAGLGVDGCCAVDVVVHGFDLHILYAARQSVGVNLLHGHGVDHARCQIEFIVFPQVVLAEGKADLVIVDGVGEFRLLCPVGGVKADPIVRPGGVPQLDGEAACRVAGVEEGGLRFLLRRDANRVEIPHIVGTLGIVKRGEVVAKAYGERVNAALRRPLARTVILAVGKAVGVGDCARRSRVVGDGCQCEIVTGPGGVHIDGGVAPQVRAEYCQIVLAGGTVHVQLHPVAPGGVVPGGDSDGLGGAAVCVDLEGAEGQPVGHILSR